MVQLMLLSPDHLLLH